MPRSLRVAPEYIKNVKDSLLRNGFPSQNALATEIGISRPTINKFFNGKPVDFTNFVEICERLGIDWQMIAIMPESITEQSDSSSQSLVGQTLHMRYQIEECLNQEEFCETYLAKDIGFPDHPNCVVKRLQSQGNERSQKFFRREARVLYQLGKHDQIPTLLADFEGKDRHFYLVHEWFEGQILSEQIQENKPWSEAQVLGFLREILEILNFVHQRDVIHRNITPQNILRQKINKKLILLNFGIVKEVSINTSEKTKSIAGGNKSYIPPEQSYGMPNFCSDIYSVGIICIQALTGINPRKFKTNSETMNIIWREKTKVSSRFANILEKMVDYNFQNRYQSVEEIFKNIENL